MIKGQSEKAVSIHILYNVSAIILTTQHVMAGMKWLPEGFEGAKLLICVHRCDNLALFQQEG